MDLVELLQKAAEAELGIHWLKDGSKRMEGFSISRLSFKQYFDDLLEVPIEFILPLSFTSASPILIAEEILVLRILDEDDEGAEEFPVGITWIFVLLHNQVLKVVATEVQQQFADAPWKKLAPLELRVQILVWGKVLLPLV